jgi:uncharacterized protein (TIRG00374 family)
MSEPKCERYGEKPSAGLSRGLVASFIVGVAVFIGLAIYGDIGSVTDSFAEFRWSYVPLILGLTCLNYILRFYKWDYYLKTLDIRMSGRDSLSIFLSGLTMSVTPGKLGEVFKSFLLKRLNGTEMSRSVPVVVAERVTDVLGLLILAALSFSAFQYGMQLLMVVLVASAALVLVIKSRRLSLWLLKRTRSYPYLTRLSDSLSAAYESAHTLFGFKNLAVATTLSVASWGFECLAMYFVLKGFGVDASVLLGTFVFSFSSLAGAVSLLPGGLLVAEGSSTGLLILAGFSRAVAASATMIIRICTLWFGVVVGLIAVLFVRRRTEKLPITFTGGA